MSIKNCRSCNSRNLVDVVSLGDQYLSDFTTTDEKPPQFPLNVILCTDCSLVQLKETTPQKDLYTPNYGYKSGINNTIRADLEEIVARMTSVVTLKEGDIVVDIGCNDGTLLKNYPDFVTKVGIDPIEKFRDEATASGIKFINGFFTLEHYQTHYKDKKAKAMTIISCFYDMEDPNQFVKDVAQVLDEDGVCIIQQNYLAGMLTQNAFDNICHEHLEFYSLRSIENLLNRHGLEVFDVETNDINGGSFRTYVRHMSRLKKMRLFEQRLKLQNKFTYMLFALRVRDVREKVHKFIAEEVKKGKKVYLYGASTRGNTLIQACNLDNRLITAAVERNPEKWGKKIASLQIPIISEEQARLDKPDILLILPWFFETEFLEREKEYLNQGGSMLFPLPTPHLATKSGIIEL